MVAIFLQNRGQKFVEHFCFPVTVLNEGFPFRVNGKLKLLKTNIDKTKNKMINKYTRRVPTSKPVTPYFLIQPGQDNSLHEHPQVTS